LPALGLGIVIKCDDGAGRAAEALMAATLSRLLTLDDPQCAALARFAQPKIRNWNDIETGELRVTLEIGAAAGG
jgi:L-asparaginase II